MKTSDITDIYKTNINLYQISWKMTEWCNFKCPYCISGLERMPHVSEEKCVEMAKKINNLINTQLSNKRILLHLIGGEVSFYNLPLILDNIEKIDSIMLVTNLSNKTQYYKDFFFYCKKRNISLMIIESQHKENKQYNEKVVEMAHFCDENGFDQPQAALLVDESFDFSVVDYLIENGVTNIKLSKIRSRNQGVPKLSDEVEQKLAYYRSICHQKGWISVTCTDGSTQKFMYGTSLIDILDEGGFKPQGYHCSIGETCCRIDWDGTVCKDSCVYGQTRIIGNMWNDDVEIPKTYEVCGLPQENFCPLCARANIHKIR